MKRLRNLRLVAALAFGVVLSLAIPADSQPKQDETSHVSGQVVSSSGAPIAGARVLLDRLVDDSRPLALWIASSTALPAASSPDDGEFEFLNLSDGRFVLSVEVPCHVTWRELLEVPRGARARREVTLRRAGSISGQILTADLRPASGVRVLVQPVPNSQGGVPQMFRASLRGPRCDAGLQGSGTTDANGRYHLVDLGPGSYFVAARRPGGQDTEATLYPGVRKIESAILVTVDEGVHVKDIDIRFVLPPYTVTGRVTDQYGGVPRAVQIEYGHDGGGHRGLFTVKAPDGQFVIDDAQLEPRRLTLFARGDSDEGPLMAMTTIDLVEGGSNEVQVTLGPPGLIRGRIVTATGSAVLPTGIQLRLVPVGFRPWSPGDGPIDLGAGAGRFVAEHLLGNYRIEVVAPREWMIQAVEYRGQRLDSDRFEVLHNDVLDVDVIIAPR